MWDNRKYFFVSYSITTGFGNIMVSIEDGIFSPIDVIKLIPHKEVILLNWIQVGKVEFDDWNKVIEI